MRNGALFLALLLTFGANAGPNIAFMFIPIQDTPYFTGGTVVESGGYRIHTFTSSGILTMVRPGKVEYLVVGGGGGGGSNRSGGGGAGGFLTGEMDVTATTSVTVGAGGSGGTSDNRGGNGGNSVFGSVIARGGGGGGGYDLASIDGAMGGSGGGGNGRRGGSGGSAWAGQGNAGGDGQGDTSYRRGGGGGGAGGPGAHYTTGIGGVGLQSSISGTPTYYAGGGGGGSESGSAVSGGLGGGGQGRSTGVGGAGTPNTGGGGGGSGDGDNGASGGSGIVIIRYPAAAPNGSMSCPAGYVAVPSLSPYTTQDFCIAKYEMKNVSGTPVSQASGTPWVSISRDTARSECQSLGSGYALITNAQWQTVARHIETVGANWSGGSVGSGEINSGHSDNSPASALAADASDDNACSGTGQSCSASTWNSQRRTHTLTNGEVVWDLAGNVYDWVNDDYSSLGVSPAISGASQELSSLSATNRALFSSSNGSWNSTQGLGRAYGGSSGGVLRGGYWTGTVAGLFGVDLSAPASSSYNLIGFRCVFVP